MFYRHKSCKYSDRQKDRQRDKQTDRETSRQTDRPKIPTYISLGPVRKSKVKKAENN